LRVGGLGFAEIRAQKGQGVEGLRFRVQGSGFRV